MFITEIIALIGIAIAIWQLNLQRIEIKRASNAQTLQYLALLIKFRIDTLEAVIKENKRQKRPYKTIAEQVNNHLKPKYNAIVKKLAYNAEVDELDIGQLQIKPENTAK